MMQDNISLCILQTTILVASFKIINGFDNIRSTGLVALLDEFMHTSDYWELRKSISLTINAT